MTRPQLGSDYDDSIGDLSMDWSLADFRKLNQKQIYKSAVQSLVSTFNYSTSLDPERERLLMNIHKLHIYVLYIIGSRVFEYIFELTKNEEIRNSIKSLVVLPHLPNCIFIEIDNPVFLRNLDKSFHFPRVNPIHFFRNLTSCHFSKALLHRFNVFARINMPPYKKDPAQVLDLDLKKKKAIVRVFLRMECDKLSLHTNRPFFFEAATLFERKISVGCREKSIFFDKSMYVQAYYALGNWFTGGSLLMKVPINVIDFESRVCKNEINLFSEAKIRIIGSRKEVIHFTVKKMRDDRTEECFKQIHMLNNVRDYHPDTYEQGLYTKKINQEFKSASKFFSDISVTRQKARQLPEKDRHYMPPVKVIWREGKEVSVEELAVNVEGPQPERVRIIHEEPEAVPTRREVFQRIRDKVESRKFIQDRVDETEKAIATALAHGSSDPENDWKEEFKNDEEKVTKTAKAFSKFGTIEHAGFVRIPGASLRFEVFDDKGPLDFQIAPYNPKLKIDSVSILSRGPSVSPAISLPAELDLVKTKDGEVGVIVKQSKGLAKILTFSNQHRRTHLSGALSTLSDDNTCRDRKDRRIFRGDVVKANGYKGNALRTVENHVLMNLFRSGKDRLHWFHSSQCHLIEDESGPVN